MSSVDASAATQGFDMLDLASFNFNTQDNATSTRYSWLTSNGNDIEALGSGITFSGGEPTAGVITSAEIDLGNNDFDNPDVVITDIPNADLTTIAGTSVDFLNGVFGANDSIVGSAFDDKLKGAGGDDIINAGDGNDELFGQDGNDTLKGAAGNDEIYGGSGDDELYGLDGFDTLFGDDGADVIDGGADTDTVDYSSSSSAVRLQLWSGQGFAGDAAGDTLTSIERVVGSDHNDTISGDDNNNTFLAGDGDDAIYAGGGNDYLDGGEGSDTLNGGDGLDTVIYASGATEGVSVQLWSGLGLAGAAAGDRLTSIERIGATD
ncbi:MAG: calcium-binding protein, partial [Pseudomonadota bacterium]